MAQQERVHSPAKIGIFGWIIRVLLYLSAIAVMTVVAYYIAIYSAKKRDETTQRQMLAPYQLPSPPQETSIETGYPSNSLVYDLSLLWDRAGRKPIIVNVTDSTVWRYLVARVLVVMSSPSVKGEIETPNVAIQIQEMLVKIFSVQRPEEIRFPSKKATLKKEIQARMNKILGGEKIVEVYFQELIFQ